MLPVMALLMLVQSTVVQSYSRRAVDALENVSDPNPKTRNPIPDTRYPKPATRNPIPDVETPHRNPDPILLFFITLTPSVE